jgi:putative ATP-dependent endonuclease of the OLD family
MLKRVEPQQIRHLRLADSRESVVRRIVLPSAADAAYKYIREGILAYPEIYFSRLVVLGEGDSEQIVLPRLLQAHGCAEDDQSIVVAPLGGRHVNHLWRLLNDLAIPYITLLDLDIGRFGGGWGRIKYAAEQVNQYTPDRAKICTNCIRGIPSWDAELDVTTSPLGRSWIAHLENQHHVFFSQPLDLDFSMIEKFSESYGIETADLETPGEAMITAVLGKKATSPKGYTEDRQRYFSAYHRLFQLRSKPVAHLSALANLSDQQLQDQMPSPLSRLLDALQHELAGLTE